MLFKANGVKLSVVKGAGVLLISDVFAVTTFILAFAGSISFGYLLLRFSFPDIRSVPTQNKLGLSLFIGFVFYASALPFGYFMGPLILLAMIPVYTLVAALALELKHRMFAPKTVKVAVPMVKVKPTVLRCPKCGAKYQKGDAFCGECGERL